LGWCIAGETELCSVLQMTLLNTRAHKDIHTHTHTHTYSLGHMHIHTDKDTHVGTLIIMRTFHRRNVFLY